MRGSLLFTARWWTVLTLIFGVLPIWLSSTEMWDGVVSVHSLNVGDWKVLKDLALDSNWYLTYGLLLLADALRQLTGLAYWVFFKFLLTLLIIGIAYEVYRLAREVFELPKIIANWLPALVLCFPVWFVFFTYTSMSGHLTCVWLGLAGYRLIYSDKKFHQALAIIFVTMSFQLASNCAFILALELGRWVVSKNKSQWSYGRSALLLLISLAVFTATRVIWPPIGTYIGYNRFLNPLQLLSWVSYAKYTVLFATWLVLLVPMVVSLWWASKHNITSKISPHEILRQDRAKTGFYIFLILSACAPYIAVGVGSPLFMVNLAARGIASVSSVLANNSTLGPVGIWFGGWGARHVLLMMIPMVLLTGWLASITYQLMKDEISFKRNLPQAAFIITIGFCLLLGVSGHWAKLKRLAKERTIVTLLTNKPPLPHGQVDLLLDEREDFVSAIYETNYMLYRAYKSTNWMALMLPENQAVQAWGDENRRITLDQAAKERIKIAGLNLMGDYNWNNSCKTIARIKLPVFDVWDVIWRTEHAPKQLPLANIVPVSSTCTGANNFWQGATS